MSLVDLVAAQIDSTPIDALLADLSAELSVDLGVESDAEALAASLGDAVAIISDFQAAAIAESGDAAPLTVWGGTLCLSLQPYGGGAAAVEMEAAATLPGVPGAEPGAPTGGAENVTFGARIELQSTAAPASSSSSSSNGSASLLSMVLYSGDAATAIATSAAPSAVEV